MNQFSSTALALTLLTAYALPAQTQGDGGVPAGTALGDRPLRNVQTLGVPPVSDDIKARIHSYQQSRFASAAGWIGGNMLVRTRFGNTTQLHLVASPMGMRSQVTFGNEPVGAVRVPPVLRPKGFVFSQDMGGTEAYQLFWHDLKTHANRLLTDGKSRHTGVIWNQDGTEFAYTTNARDGQSWDIHAQNLEGDSRVLWEINEVGWSARDWAPTGNRILLEKYVSRVNSTLHELDLDTGKSRLLAPRDGVASIGTARYSADGTEVYFTSDLGSEWVSVHRLDRASGEISPVIPPRNWNVDWFSLSPNRDLMAIVFNEDGYGVLRLLELETGQLLDLPTLPQGLLGGIHFAYHGQSFAITLQTPESPSDVYVVEVGSKTLTRWTRSELGPLDPARLRSPELIRYPSFDDREIPAFVFWPDGPGPHPVFISIHGGPESQFRPRFNTDAQFLAAELGLAVIAPNVRGSSGYGKTWLQLDDRELREDSVRDIGSLLDWIEAAPNLDASRVVVYGGSYGGYMVLASMVHFSERLAAGIEIVGISDLVTFLENTKGYRRDLRRAEYGDERDPAMREFLTSIAPVSRVDRITRPMLIGQGLNDPRVPASESQQIVDALTAKRLPVWYVLAEDEGHGFAKKPNRDYWDQVVAMFLTEQLGLHRSEAGP